MVFIKMLQTKTGTNASRAMRNDLIPFQIKYNAAMSYPEPSNLKQSYFIADKTRDFSQKIFRVRRPFFNPPCLDAL